MAGKLIDLGEAAKILGKSEEELNEMRMRGDIAGVRDGSDWKFKSEEVQRVAEGLGIAPSGSGIMDDTVEEALDADGLSDLDLEAEAGEADDSATAVGSLADFESAETGESGLSLSMDDDDDLTIGDDDEIEAPGEADVLDEATSGSDLGVGSDAADVLAGSGTNLSDVALVPDDSGSGLNLVAGSSADVLSGTDPNLGASSSGPGTGSGLGEELEFEGSDIDMVSDLALDEDEGVAVGEEEDELTIGEDEELALGEDDELVLEGGSDVTGGGGDSGINLGSPSDSGLNLEEEPLDLVGSSVSSLELPEDDDMIDLDDLDASPDEATQLKVDEDFQLEPSMGAEEDDEEDSGSQVIALEDSEAFEQAAPIAADDAVEPIVGGDADELDGALDAADAAPVTQPALPESALGGGRPELPYSIWNILSLLAILLILSITGMLMTDLVRNMWSWDGTYSASSPVMDMMVQVMGLEP